jgi:hypothetical protein
MIPKTALSFRLNMHSRYALALGGRRVPLAVVHEVRGRCLVSRGETLRARHSPEDHAPAGVMVLSFALPYMILAGPSVAIQAISLSESTMECIGLDTRS